MDSCLLKSYQEIFTKKRDSFKRNYFDTFVREFPDLISADQPMTRANVLKMEDRLEDMLEDKNKRKKINSNYDHSKADSYKGREERDEWHIVGLLGQIQITKGQPVASNWIKMKDVSDTVELYFVK